MKFKQIISLLVFLLFSVLYFVDLSFSQSFNTEYIFYQIRIPTFFMAIISGSILSLTGLTYQYLFQNHLASPYTLGMASASAFGASLFVLINSTLLTLPYIFQPILGMVFAILTILLLYWFVSRNSFNGLSQVLLAGIALSLVFSSLIVFIQFIVGNRDGFELMVSLLGNLSMVGYSVPIYSTLCLIFLFSFLYKDLSRLRLFSVNRDYFNGQVKTSGLLFKKSIIIPSLATAYIVTEVGPISFVGLITPHIVRMSINPIGKSELYYNVLIGSTIMLVCDLLARRAFDSIELPVGIFTSIIGGVFLFSLLLKKQSN